MLSQPRVEYRLAKCTECGHVYLNPRPDLSSIGFFYPSDYGPHQEVPQGCVQAKTTNSNQSKNALFEGLNLVRWLGRLDGLRRLHRWLLDSKSTVIPVLDIANPRALEIGCGAGRFLDLLREAGWETHGIEPADIPAERCRYRGLRVTTGSIENVAVPKNFFNAVFAWMVLEHVHEPRTTLQKIAESLCIDGRLLISVPNFGCWEPKIFGRYWYGFQLVHLNYFTIGELDRMLRAEGMCIEKVFFQTSVRNLIGSLGLFVRERLRLRVLGDWLVQCAADMSMWSQLAFSPLAKILSWLGQSGRITIQARKMAT